MGGVEPGGLTESQSRTLSVSAPHRRRQRGLPKPSIKQRKQNRAPSMKFQPSFSVKAATYTLGECRSQGRTKRQFRQVPADSKRASARGCMGRPSLLTCVSRQGVCRAMGKPRLRIGDENRPTLLDSSQLSFAPRAAQQ